MGIGSMARYQIQHYFHIPPVRFFKQTDQIFIRSVSLRDFFIIADIVAAVFERGIKTGIEP